MGCLCLRKSASFPSVPHDVMQTLKKETTLSRSQIKYLYIRFTQFSGGGKDSPGQLYKYNFYSGLLHLNPLLPTILNSMFGDKITISFYDFALFLSTFQAHSLKDSKELKNATKKRKLDLLFNMYDHNKDGRITRYDLVIVVHKLFSHLLDHVQIMRVVDTMMREMDQSDMNYIQYEDFCKALEAFDMTEKMVTWIPEFHGRTHNDLH
ncbi:calcineurin B homologous protein 1 [Drosophila ficusphila]|uniref:calcineurin B homologous protein 1 n=1 Tax=Drosophila ficusphila TaxID=30025 RepID=UPI0007E80693|nr:calcineurin B homologous protein 1 [Drosophila ficusphila]